MSTPLDQMLAQCSGDDKETIEKAIVKVLEQHLVNKEHNKIGELLEKLPNNIKEKFFYDQVVTRRTWNVDVKAMILFIKAQVKTNGPLWKEENVDGVVSSSLLENCFYLNKYGFHGAGHGGSGIIQSAPLNVSQLETLLDACPELLYEEGEKIFIERIAEYFSHTDIIGMINHLQETLPILLKGYKKFFTTFGSLKSSFIKSYKKGITSITQKMLELEHSRNHELCDHLDILARIAANDPRITDFETRDLIEYDPEIFSENLGDSLKKNTQIRTLRVLASQDCAYLKRVFPANQTITTLILDSNYDDDCNMDGDGISIFQQHILNNTHVNRISIMNNAITDIEMFRFISTHPQIKTLYLDNFHEEGDICDPENLKEIISSATVGSFTYVSSGATSLIYCIQGLTKNPHIRKVILGFEANILTLFSERVSENSDHSPYPEDSKSTYEDWYIESFCDLIKTNHHLEELVITTDENLDDPTASDFFKPENVRKLFNALASNLNIQAVAYVKTKQKAYDKVLLEYLSENPQIVKIYGHKTAGILDFDSLNTIENTPKNVENKVFIETATKLLERNRTLQPLILILKEAIAKSASVQNKSSDLKAKAEAYDTALIQKAFQEAEQLYQKGLQDIYLILGNFCERWLNKDPSIAIRAYTSVSDKHREHFVKAQTQLSHLKMTNIHNHLLGLEGESHTSEQFYEATTHALNAKFGYHVDSHDQGDAKDAKERVEMDTSEDLVGLASEKFLNDGSPDKSTLKITSQPKTLLFLMRELKQAKSENKRLRESQKIPDSQKIKDDDSVMLEASQSSSTCFSSSSNSDTNHSNNGDSRTPGKSNDLIGKKRKRDEGTSNARDGQTTQITLPNAKRSRIEPKRSKSAGR